MNKGTLLFAIIAAMTSAWIFNRVVSAGPIPAAFGVTIPSTQSLVRVEASAATLEVYVDSVLEVHENLTGAVVHGVLEANDGDELTIRPLSSWIGDGVEVLVSMTIDDVTCAVELVGEDCE